MVTRLISVVICLFFTTLVNAKNFAKLEEAFEDFCTSKKISHLVTSDYKKEVNEKKAFLQLYKSAHLIQFSRYTKADGSAVYLFNYFADTSYYKAGIIVGCYEYENNVWKEVTDVVMPMLNFKDFYGPDIAPPKAYMNTVQFRYELHTTDYIKMIIEPNWSKIDEKKERIFEQKKYSALQLKWNKHTGTFDINKWLR